MAREPQILTVRPSHRVQVQRDDRRMLLAWVLVFLTFSLLLLAVRGVYRATGPHPETQAFVRRLKHEARWLIPGLKSRPNARFPVD